MATMPHSPPGSSRPPPLSELIACEKARARLKVQLSALKERWRPISQRVEQQQAEASDTHKRLKNCISQENELAKSCAMTEDAIRMFRDCSAKLKQRTDDSEKQVDKLFETVEGLKRDIRSKNIRLKEAKEKVKDLSKINRSLFTQLSLQPLQGAESKNSARASAKGKRKIGAAKRGM